MEASSQMMSDFSEKNCIPCKGGIPSLKGECLSVLMKEINDDWNLVEDHHLEREFKFPNFKEAWDYLNRVSEMSEEQDHHPDLELSWGRVKVTIWTHKIDGLTESDFVFAAKCDSLLA